MTAKSACFTVSGEFVAKHARERVFDFGWEDALRFLTEAISELTYKQSVEVLRGLKTFTGDSDVGLELADESTKIKAAVEAQYRYKYAGTWYDRSTKKRWQPYAYVCGWGADDMATGRIPNKYHQKPSGSFLSLPGNRQTMVAYGLFRCVAYMDDSADDRVVAANVPGVGQQNVLWKEAQSCPLWWRELTTPQLAVVEWVREHGLPQERGAHKKARPAKLKEDAPAESGPAVDLATITNAESSVIRSLLPADLPDHVKDGLERALTDSAEEYKVPEPADPKTVKWAWIDQQGRAYPCRGYMDHIPLAHALAAERGLNLELWNGNAERALEQSGWAKVGFNVAGEPWAYAEKSTARQRDAVYDWLVANGAGPEMLKRWVERQDGFDY